MVKKLSYIFNRRDKIKLLFLMAAVMIGSLLELWGVGVFMPFTNIIMDPSSIQEKGYLKFFYELFDFQTTESFLAALTGVIILIYIAKNVFMALQKNFIYKFSYNLQMRISTRLLDSYMHQPYTFHLNKNIAVLQRSLQEDTDLFAKGIIHVLELVAELAVCGVLGIYLFMVSRSITASVLLLLLICIGIFTSISRRFSKNLGKKCQEYKGKLYQWMNQALGGIKEVKILNREEYFVSSYRRYFEKYVYGLRINRLIAVLPRYFVEAVCMTGLLLAVIFKMFFGQTEFTTYIPQLAVFAVAAFKLLPSVGKINEHVADILYSAPSLDLIYHDLKEIDDSAAEAARDEERERRAGAHEASSESVDKDRENWHFEQELLIHNVSYHYPGSEEPVIDEVNFSVTRGKTVAFIGPSGAGKTTMADILLGLLKPQFGKVLADGLNIHKHLRTWQKEIGYIPQVIYLSDDTIRNNVAFGIREEEIDEEAVVNALRKAQLFEFVDNLPDGLDTYVGDRGVRLSGGQRQRIGIARALYHDPQVLVLDEATSALDNETEAAVMEAVDSLHGAKTMIIIAHRLTTIRNVDMIYEIAEGKVKEKSKEEVFG